MSVPRYPVEQMLDRAKCVAPRRGAGVCTGTPAAAPAGPSAPGPTPPPDPRLMCLLQNAHRFGVVEGEVAGYKCGWRYGLVCGAIGGAILISAITLIGYAVGMSS